MGGTKMFKIGSFEIELAKTMQTNLVSNKSEKKYSFDKITKAIDYLNAASEILDDTGFHNEAEVLTSLLETLASGGIKKKFDLDKTAGELSDLSKEDVKFFHSLAPHHKEKLYSLIKKHPSGKSTDLSAFVDEVKKMKINNLISEELEQKPQEIPETIEMQSLVPKSPQQLGDQVIDIRSLAEAIKKKV
jgi:hypothetical protein